MPIDWEDLAQRLGAGMGGSTALARRALAEIIGDQHWRAAVDFYVENQTGAELARSVMWHVHPWAAMERCHEIFLESADEERRASAIELLRVVADGRVLPRVRMYLADPNHGVRYWAVGILDQLLWSDLVEPEDCADLLKELSHSSDAGIREQIEWIQSFLKVREQGDGAGET